jgi:hypothetical protein
MRDTETILAIAHDVASKLEAQNKAMQHLVNSQLNRARTRAFYEEEAGSDTVINIAVPTNNTVEIHTIHISAPSATTTVTLKIGNRTRTLKVGNSNNGCWQFRGMRHVLKSGDKVTLTADVAGPLYMSVYGEQQGDAQNIS